MKTSEVFKKTIKKHLDGLAERDSLFKVNYEKPEKKLDDCITYILNTVKNSKCNGFADEEIYNMATHYYDEEVEVGEKMDARVIVNHTVKLTDEEIAKAKKVAIDKVIEEQTKKMHKDKHIKQPQKEEAPKLTLF